MAASTQLDTDIFRGKSFAQFARLGQGRREGLVFVLGDGKDELVLNGFHIKGGGSISPSFREKSKEDFLPRKQVQETVFGRVSCLMGMIITDILKHFDFCVGQVSPLALRVGNLIYVWGAIIPFFRA